MLFVAIDANFQLKRRHISSDLKNPGLSQGWGYFIEDNKYKAYLKANASIIQEVGIYIHLMPHMLIVIQAKYMRKPQHCKYGRYKAIERAFGHWCWGCCLCAP